jgi:hypothetical protein
MEVRESLVGISRLSQSIYETTQLLSFTDVPLESKPFELNDEIDERGLISEKTLLAVDPTSIAIGFALTGYLLNGIAAGTNPYEETARRKHLEAGFINSVITNSITGAVIASILYTVSQVWSLAVEGAGYSFLSFPLSAWSIVAGGVAGVFTSLRIFIGK